MIYYKDDALANECMEVLEESSMSRMVEHNRNHDIAIITAFRYFPEKKNEAGEWEQIADRKAYYRENIARNKKLESALRQNNIPYSRVRGFYTEASRHHKRLSPKSNAHELSFLCVNLEDREDFKDILLGLAKEFNQDSIYYKEPNRGARYIKPTGERTKEASARYITKYPKAIRAKTKSGKYKGGYDQAIGYTEIGGKKFQDNIDFDFSE